MRMQAAHVDSQHAYMYQQQAEQTRLFFHSREKERARHCKDKARRHGWSGPAWSQMQQTKIFNARPASEAERAHAMP